MPMTLQQHLKTGVQVMHETLAAQSCSHSIADSTPGAPLIISKAYLFCLRGHHVHVNMHA